MAKLSTHLLVAGLATAGLFAALPEARAAEARPWNLSLRGWGGYDSNVAQVATDDTTFSGDGGHSSSSVYGLMLAGDYRLYRAGRWQVTGTGSLLQTINGDSDLNDFNLTSFSPGVAARYSFRAGSKPAKLSTSLGLRWDALGGDRYAQGQSLNLDLSLKPSRASEVGWFASGSSNDFAEDGSQPELSSRDGIVYRSGLRGSLNFNNNRQALSGSLAWQENQAEGDNFDYRGPAAALQLRSYLVGPWSGALSLGCSRAEYFHYATTPQRESKNRDLRLSFYGPLAANLTADLSLGWGRSKAEPTAFQSERKNLTVGVTYAF